MVFEKKKVVPKLEEPKEETTETWEDEAPAKPVANLTHTALSTYQDPTTQKWHLVKVMYDPVTKQAGNVELQEFEGKYAVIDQFKIQAIQNKIV